MKRIQWDAVVSTCLVLGGMTTMLFTSVNGYLTWPGVAGFFATIIGILIPSRGMFYR